MLAALYVNYAQQRTARDTHDPGWRIEGDHLPKRTQKEIDELRRKHIEDAYNRLMEIPEAAEKIREVIKVEEPDFRILIRNQQVTLLLMQLYVEYLDDEDILIMYASLL